ncbi:interferon alpha-inducible protein 27-like protein 2 isoform X2 [Kryptolebias marmoratus]|uniref:Interferon alpha-inducible protein 27-like protein 2 n=1 Tax=Kryptolebias marmoratus TaxID=37003 RepID=A0A3Q3B5Y0_KRYMA|nr:interferon alpha-inducible protein 27-like protein 2 isoform X2 [Kryptolebias marmoratus]
MFFGRTLTISGGAAVGGVGAVMAAPLVLGAIGFTSTGIAAGSFAASMMSAAAVANGGGVAAGSLVALLQSAGAAGLSATANAALAGIGGIFGAGFGWLASVFQEEEERKRKEEEERKCFWMTVALASMTLYIYLNGCGPVATTAAALVSVGAAAGWLVGVIQERNERKRREEVEKYVLLGIGALALVSYMNCDNRAVIRDRQQDPKHKVKNN